MCRAKRANREMQKKDLHKTNYVRGRKRSVWQKIVTTRVLIIFIFILAA